MKRRYFRAPRFQDVPFQISHDLLNNYGESRPLSIQTTYPGLAFDFNCGLRLQIPAGNWHVKIIDYNSEVVCFDEDVSDILLISLEKFFVRWQFFIWLNGKLVIDHTFNPEGWRVHIVAKNLALGDCIALLPYIEEFRKKWKCQLSCSVKPYMQEIIKLYYPNLECTETPNYSYATYAPELFFNAFFMPNELRKYSMEKIGQQSLGINRVEKVLYHPTKPRQIKEPYVCIAVQASITPKSWLNPNGWRTVINYLKNLGYRVLCTDKNRVETSHGITVKMPEGAEDFTGDLPLIERVNLLAYADFFIGIGSGLSWLAWATGVPVILISGISATWFEFDNPYRVINLLVCHGCMNDTSLPWGEYEKCPRYRGTDRVYECSKKISARQVIQMINQLLDDKRTGRLE